MTTCTYSKIDRASLVKLKERALGCEHPNWDDIISLVKSVVGNWAKLYNSIRQFEMEKCLEFSPAERAEHLSCIEASIDVGCDLLLLVHYVEDKSDPKRDLSDLNTDITHALRALKLSRSSFSEDVSDVELPSFKPNAA